MSITVIIPAYNEEESIGQVIDDIPTGVADEIIVIDNNSYDHTSDRAEDAGAEVIKEYHKGYGQACMKGIEYIKEYVLKPEIVVFMDGDNSYYPEEIIRLINPLLENQCELVIGSRMRGEKDKRSIPVFDKLYSKLICRMVNKQFKTDYTDICHFKAIKYKKLLNLELTEMHHCWDIEFLVNALIANVKIKEVPVSYRKRVGHSKLFGSFPSFLSLLWRSIILIMKAKRVITHERFVKKVVEQSE